MSYNIAIPSLGRYSLINSQTIKALQDYNISSEYITIFVVEKEYQLYRDIIDMKYKVIIGELGLVQQRNFIENYYPAGSNILFLDDDIKEIDLQLASTNSLDSFIKSAFQDCKDNNCFIWSIYPVFNLYFRQTKEYKTDCLNYMVGAFYGIINRPNDKELKLIITAQGDKEDVERSILYFKKDGKTIRYNQIGFKTKYYGHIGGLGTLNDRMPYIVENTKLLEKHFTDYGKIKIRKNGIYEFVLNKIKSKVIDKEVIIGQSIDKNIFSTILEMLNKLKFVTRQGRGNRLGFPIHKTVIFGNIKGRFTGIVDSSVYTKKYPDIFEELKRIANIINPNFVYNVIQINHNLVCPKHIDKDNINKSMIISIGNYTGCKLVINDITYDSYYCPIYFNGSCLEHYNTDDLVGNKYSIIFYN